MVYTVCKKKIIIAHGLPVGAPPGKNVKLRLCLLSCYKLNRCYIKLSLVNILENVFVFIEILFKILLFKGGVHIYAEHCKT